MELFTIATSWAVVLLPPLLLFPSVWLDGDRSGGAWPSHPQWTTTEEGRRGCHRSNAPVSWTSQPSRSSRLLFLFILFCLFSCEDGGGEQNRTCRWCRDASSLCSPLSAAQTRCSFLSELVAGLSWWKESRGGEEALYTVITILQRGRPEVHSVQKWSCTVCRVQWDLIKYIWKKCACYWRLFVGFYWCDDML